MKRAFADRIFAAAISAVLFCVVLGTVCAQTNYSVDWYTADGGGGTSTNGVYAVTGTIGQPDGGAAMTDGYYHVDGGFWSLIAVVQTPGAPSLHITRAGASVIVAWPYPSSGFGLQWNAVLGTTNWAYVTNVPAQVGGEWQVTVPPAGNQFYRLAGHAAADTISLSATSGVITAPFVITSGYIYQPVETTMANGGRATYNFSLGNPGTYVIDTVVNAPDDGANSFYLNIDGEPQDPYMVWDVPFTSGFEQRTVSWRGNGTGNDQFVPKVFGLAPGAHQIVIRGREAFTLLQSLTVTPYP